MNYGSGVLLVKG